MFVYPLTRPVRTAHRVAAAQQLNRAIERLFDDTHERFLGGAKPDSAARTPALDVLESDTTYAVVLDVPGATRDQLKVTIEGRRLSIETAAPEAQAPAGEAAPKDGERVLYRERDAARYARTVILPAEVDQASSQAKVENGVLTLTLVKKVPTGARQISIS